MKGQQHAFSHIIHKPHSAACNLLPHRIFSFLKLLNPWFALQSQRKLTTANRLQIREYVVKIFERPCTLVHAEEGRPRNWSGVWNRKKAMTDDREKQATYRQQRNKLKAEIWQQPQHRAAITSSDVKGASRGFPHTNVNFSNCRKRKCH